MAARSSSSVESPPSRTTGPGQPGRCRAGRVRTRQSSNPPHGPSALAGVSPTLRSCAIAGPAGRERTCPCGKAPVYVRGMHIAVLGPLEVRSDSGDRVPVPGGKRADAPGAARRGCTGRRQHRPARRRALERRPPTDRAQVAADPPVRLRRALEPQRPRGSPGRFVVRRGAGYSPAAIWRSWTLWASVSWCPAVVRCWPVATRAGPSGLSSTALDLWRGDPYQDWPDAPFAEAERTRLAELRAGARGSARSAAGAGDARRGRRRPPGSVTEDPLREDWWRLLVLALYRSGRQGDALAALQRSEDPR